ncbi:MAG: alpha/beta hydrolase [Pseudomonadota bacterium]
MEIALIVLLVLVLGLLALIQLAPARMTAIGLGLERRRSGLARKEATVPGFCMPYLEGGSGTPLILVHGFAGDKDNFTRMARWLTPHYRVILPDLPGFGEAGRDPAALYTIDAQVERLRQFCDALGLERIDLGGNSMGGFIAAQFCAMYPERVRSVWLLDNAGTEASLDTDIVAHYKATGEMPLLLSSLDGVEAMVRAVATRPIFMPGFVKRTLGARAMADFALHTKIMQDFQDSPMLEARYRDIPVPALVLWGREDKVLSVKAAAVTAALFAKSQVVIIERMGHVPMLEAPRASARIYLDFARSL